MAIDVKTAKTLVDRIESYLQSDKTDPAFVFSELFKGIWIDEENTMSSIGNFLLQLRFDGEHLYDFVKATPQNTPKEKPCGKIPSGRA